jgi:hypothetical protein
MVSIADRCRWQTAAAMLVARDIMALSAAAAAELVVRRQEGAGSDR